MKTLSMKTRIILLPGAMILTGLSLQSQVRVYKGTSRYTSDVICKVDDGRVYKKTSIYTSDIEFTIDDNLTNEEFVAVWYAVKYCY
jgi:hypothetical protein